MEISKIGCTTDYLQWERTLPALSTRVQRFLLPGFAFKALVIGGGYATGRELATFFLPSGPLGGLWAMLLD